jgi:O6-methylguanine-DNA--protein-cysteine methyltransferase
MFSMGAVIRINTKNQSKYPALLAKIQFGTLTTYTAKSAAFNADL